MQASGEGPDKVALIKEINYFLVQRHFFLDKSASEIFISQQFHVEDFQPPLRWPTAYRLAEQFVKVFMHKSSGKCVSFFCLKV